MLMLGPREMAAALAVLARGDLSRFSGSRVSQTRRFENELAATLGTKHAIAMNSGTSALISALAAAGIGPGDEVLVPAFTWVSSAAAPLAVGAVPVLVDIDESLTIDPADIRRKITPHTRAIIPVHMLNLVCDMDAIMEIADEHQLVVIEDAAQAVGVRDRGKRVGTIGHAGALSFNQHKNIKSGEGGALLTDDPRLHARAGMYHDVGSYERDERFDTDEPLFVGVNYRMPELSAAILRPQLKRLDKQLRLRHRRRELVLNELRKRDVNFTVAPHHDPSNAVGLAVSFSDPEEAAAFGSNRGVLRLIDSGRHVFSNWQSLLSRRTAHPAMNPFKWAHREIDYSPESYAATLEILSRTCSIDLAPELPGLAYRLLAHRLATSGATRQRSEAILAGGQT